jgi:hypothetical protein
MAPFISDAEWQQYEDDINSFNNDAFQQSITWVKSINIFDTFGREKPKTKSVELKGLINYNHFRSWPINKESITGQIDKESMLLYLNHNYLLELGLINENGIFDFKPDLDKFIIDGLEYSAKGNSQTAQTKNKTLLHFIVLKREEKST